MEFAISKFCPERERQKNDFERINLWWSDFWVLPKRRKAKKGLLKVPTCDVPIFELCPEGGRRKNAFEGINVCCCYFWVLPRRRKAERGHFKVWIGGFLIFEFRLEGGRQKSPLSAEMTIFGCRVVLLMAKWLIQLSLSLKMNVQGWFWPFLWH